MSEWVGNIGDHTSAQVIFKGYVWRERWGNDVPKLYILEDKDGNILTIRSKAKFTIGQGWKVYGTVKHHKVFRGQKQTHLSNWELMLSGKQNGKPI